MTYNLGWREYLFSPPCCRQCCKLSMLVSGSSHAGHITVSAAVRNHSILASPPFTSLHWRHPAHPRCHTVWASPTTLTKHRVIRTSSEGARSGHKIIPTGPEIVGSAYGRSVLHRPHHTVVRQNCPSPSSSLGLLGSWTPPPALLTARNPGGGWWPCGGVAGEVPYPVSPVVNISTDILKTEWVMHRHESMQLAFVVAKPEV